MTPLHWELGWWNHTLVEDWQTRSLSPTTGFPEGDASWRTHLGSWRTDGRRCWRRSNRALRQWGTFWKLRCACTISCECDTLVCRMQTLIKKMLSATSSPANGDKTTTWMKSMQSLDQTEIPLKPKDNGSTYDCTSIALRDPCHGSRSWSDLGITRDCIDRAACTHVLSDWDK